ncbi:hypothetical protein [Nocardia wallacei]|uniref:Uncharacterized protein n=1 Tax=Nocardia wallacei TaxID=480035 RepID=A0A7G1KFW4_9NOCA|nr:hypothetical protein [Nocardia wallacei]BCK53995.1 hypothetical protein NWFMUON74_17670 [Nocardia wallacei]
MNPKRNRQRHSHSRDPFDVVAGALLELVWQVVRVVFVVAWWAVLFPVITLPLAVAVAAGLLLGWGVGVVVVGVFAAGIMLGRRRRPEMFERWVTSRARTRFRAWRRYRWRWAARLHACHLTIRDDEAVRVPRLIGVQIGATVDRLRVRMLEGQCPEDYENRVERIAHTFGAQECRATVAGPGVMELVLRQSDSLAETITLPTIDGPGRTGEAA